MWRGSRSQFSGNERIINRKKFLGEVVYKDEMEWSEEALSLYWISDRLDDFITVRTGNRGRRPEE
jgi:hypothetical protein